MDWEDRFNILADMLRQDTRKSTACFDCILGVSGGKDSTRQALFLKEKLDLNPLLICCSYPPEQITDRGASNISNLISLGFDVHIISPAPGTWKKLMKESFMRFCNWGKSTEMALFASVPQFAIRYKIPLIFWGENPGLQLGDCKTLGRFGYDGNNLRNMNTLSGGNIEWMHEAGFSRSDLIPYLYPSKDEFSIANLQIVYLGWFLKDWSEVTNAMYSVVNGLEIREDTVEHTGDPYGITALDEDWVSVNQMVKYYKFGFGRTTDFVNEDIRAGKITREQGIKIVEEFDDACSYGYIADFCDYIEISTKRFWEVVKTMTNKTLFSITRNGKISPKFQVGVGL